MLISYILTGEVAGINLSAADVNQNNSINISDAIDLINIILNDNK